MAAGKAPNPKEIEKIRKEMKAHIAKSKKAPKLKKSDAPTIAKGLKEERGKLIKALKALASAPDA